MEVRKIRTDFATRVTQMQIEAYLDGGGVIPTNEREFSLIRNRLAKQARTCWRTASRARPLRPTSRRLLVWAAKVVRGLEVG